MRILKNIQAVRNAVIQHIRSEQMGNGLRCARVLIMKALERDDIIFVITKEELQYEAMNRIGRELTDDEIEIAKDGIEWGISDSALDITYNTIFTEMIEK